MKQMGFEPPILTDLKHFKNVVPLVAGTGVVSDVCICDREAALGM